MIEQATNRERAAVGSRSAIDWAARLAAILALTLFAAGLARATRRSWDLGPLSWQALTGLGWDAWGLAVLVQQALVAVAGLALLLRWRPMRAVALDHPDPGDRWRATAALAGLQLVALAAGLGLESEIELGFAVTLAAGLLVGWPAGLAVALTMVAATGLVLELQYGWAQSELAATISGGPGGPLALAGLLFQPQLVAFPWIGLAAGIVGGALGARRLRPAWASALGAGLSFLAGYLAAGFQGDPTYLVGELILPATLVGALAMGALGALVEGLRAEATRRRAEIAETARIRAELLALRAQINPHFLFNALNTIRYFIREDPPTARRLLLDLSAVYQRAFRAGETIPLREELEHVEAYLALESARLGERLRVSWSHPEDPDALSTAVPTLILQPLVENAVQHAVAPRTEGGTIEITIEAGTEDEANALRLTVADDGPGIAPERLARLLAEEEGEAGTASASTPEPTASLAPSDVALGSPPTHRSIGLRNVDRRLRALYGAQHALRIDAAPGTGTTVSFTIPGT